MENGRLEVVKEPEIIVNIPVPVTVKGFSLEHALKQYTEVCGKIFAENKNNGIELKVHTIQIVPPDTVVFFIVAVQEKQNDE